MESPNNDIRERMVEVADAVRVRLPPDTGFIVLAFDLDVSKPRLEYVSNAVREHVLTTMKEFISYNENPDNYLKHEKEK